MQYNDYRRNYAIPHGYEHALDAFLDQTHEGVRHKQRHKCNSNSEDALTWSCFTVLSDLPLATQQSVLGEVFEDAYGGQQKLLFDDCDDIEIYVGKEYVGTSSGESTELDASIELPGALVFFEAKLYSAMSSATSEKRDQIARKLRVGMDSPLGDAREFFFIFLDIAPCDKLKANKRGAKLNSSSGFNDKWKSAYYFNRYKADHEKMLSNTLADITDLPARGVADNMGWLTWSDLFKSILRGML